MPAPRTPITDSPWFWAYLFGTAALIALALLSPKYGPRQAQLEREFQGRQRAAQNLNGEEPSIAMSSEGRTLISLRPLFFGLAAVTLIAWVVFWLRRQVWASDGQPVLASGGRQMASGGRQMASGGRQMASGGRQMASGGREPPETA